VTRFKSKWRRGRQKYRRSFCREWTGAISGNGYGNVHYNGQWYPTHRLIWEIVRGPIPAGLKVLHHCDNRACGNLRHLFLGTQKDNIHDMWRKNRAVHPPHYVGSAHPQSKLTEKQIARIKRNRANGAFVKDLAQEYGVAYQLISRISRGEIWAHVKGATVKRTQGNQR
jgi:hypothetical protein